MEQVHTDDGRPGPNQEEQCDRQVVRQMQQLEDIEALEKSPGMGSRENRTAQRQQDRGSKAPEKRFDGGVPYLHHGRASYHRTLILNRSQGIRVEKDGFADDLVAWDKALRLAISMDKDAATARIGLPHDAHSVFLVA